MITSSKTVLILGCGWLGLPLATHLRRLGYDVKGSTTNDFTYKVLSGSGIEAHLIDFSQDMPDPAMAGNADIVVVTIPPGKIDGEDKSLVRHKNISKFVAELKPELVVYTSSTSAYDDVEETVSEENAMPESFTTRLEEIYKTDHANSAILRFGGLYGPNRNPGRFLAGKTGVQKPNAPVNMTHLEDAVNAVVAVIKSGSVGIFNVVAPQHPTKKEYYTALAGHEKLTPPVFDENDRRKGKTVSSEKLIRQLNFVFTHPDPFH